MTLEATERDELVADLRALLADHGKDRFVDAPLIEPNAEFFPDLWSPDEAGVNALARRIFRYAGLADAALTFRAERSHRRAENREAIAGRATSVREIVNDDGPACLLTTAPGSCTLGIDYEDLHDPSMLAASLCRSAAAAFRFAPQATYRDPQWVPPTSDKDFLLRAAVGSVYLGFGIVTTNDAYRFFDNAVARDDGRIERSMGSHLVRTGGVVSLDGMAFLLAVQGVAREWDSAERRRVASLLDPSQAEAFAEHSRDLRETPLDLG